MDIKAIKKDILEYDLYCLLDNVAYGDYSLSIFNEDDSIIIALYDEWGAVAYIMDKDEFLNINTTEELKKRINNILYYNYIKEGE